MSKITFGASRWSRVATGFGVFRKNNAAPSSNFMTWASPLAAASTTTGPKQSDFHLVRGLGPAHQFVQIIQRKCVQHFGRELNFAAVQIVFAQNQSQRLNDQKIGAARITEDMSPSSRLLDLPVASAGNGRTALPAFTTIPSPCPNAAATPESRSLPVMIFACGQISAHRRETDCRSSSVAHPARKTPTRFASFGNSEKSCANDPASPSAILSGGSLPDRGTRSRQASPSPTRSKRSWSHHLRLREFFRLAALRSLAPYIIAT